MDKNDLPQPGALISLREAQKSGRCRICGEVIEIPSKDGKRAPLPKGWRDTFGRMCFPVKITLNYGEEFAHTECLEVPG